MSLHSYEDWGSVSAANQVAKPEIMEAFSGTDIVAWYGRIEQQIDRMVEENETRRNHVYANKLREFLKQWRENEITGSMNMETVNALKAAAEILAVDSWDLKGYFSALRDSLRKLKASEEELPRVDMEQNEPQRGPGAGGGMPPMAPEFGPEDNEGGLAPETAGAMDGPEGEEDLDAEDPGENDGFKPGPGGGPGPE